MTLQTVVQIGHLARRALVRSMREPAGLFFSLVFPLVFLAVIASGLDPAERLPGFPADSFLDFALAIPFVHGALFVAINGAVELARDLETGFLNRLALTPATGPALVLGQLVAGVVFGVVQSFVYLGVGWLAGAELETGVAGALVLVVLAAIVALAFGALGSAIAFRTASAEAVQAMFPMFFVLFFLSSMNLPRNLIEADWFRLVATVNPVSYLIEGLRSLVITGWDAQALALSFGLGAALVAGGLFASAVAFRERLTRT